MKKIKIIFLLMVSFSYGFAQQSVLHGQILTRYTSEKDGKTNFDTVRFSGTNVYLVNQVTKDTIKTRTVTDGRFYAENVQKGNYSLYVDDPVLKSKRPIHVSVIGSRKNTIQPIVVDRADDILKVVKKK